LGETQRSHSHRDGVCDLSGARAVARAIDALRRGWPVSIDGVISVLSIEAADDRRLADFGGASDVLLSSSRAVTLKLANQVDAATPGKPVRVAAEPWLDLPAARALADPALDLATPLKGPYHSIACGDERAAGAALELAIHAGFLPAFFIADGTVDGAEPATSDAIAHWDAAERLQLVTRARLPIAACETAEIIAFRSPESASEHVALLIGQPNGNPPLIRLHSECLTGDVFASLKCDCGPQLEAALAKIAESGWGILLYLRQEGRGIGLINKLRAYALQDQGFDTVDANTRLGFPIDARNFGTAAQMVKLLGQNRVRLLTNNPNKVTGLEKAGVTVVERVAHALPPNPHNHAYLATKRDRTGHVL
jgi:GTP cyclohydrolase II